MIITRGGKGGPREVMYVFLWLICVVVRQKPSQHCQAVFLQLKNKFKKMITMERMHNITIMSEIQKRNRATEHVSGDVTSQLGAEG